MTEETSTKNSKAVIVRRFCGFLFTYYLVVCCFLGISGFCANNIVSFLGLKDVNIIAHLVQDNGLFIPFVLLTIPVIWILIPLYVLLALFCFVCDKPRFICQPSEISSLHLFLLLFSFALLLFFLGVGIYKGILDIPFNPDLVQMISWILGNVSAIIFTLSLSFKSTFRKRIFIKKEVINRKE